MSGINSQWRKNAIRQRPDKKVDHTRRVKDRRGFWRTVTDSPTEVEYCARIREGFGWRNGARVQPQAN